MSAMHLAIGSPLHRWFFFGQGIHDVPPILLLGALCLIVALVVYDNFPRHLAWPLSLAAGLYCLDAADILPRAVLFALVGMAVGIAVAGAVLRVAWVFGASWGSGHAIPEDPETPFPVVAPGRLWTLVAAGASGTLAGLLWWVTWGSAPPWAWWFAAAAAFVLVARVVDLDKDIGMLKTAQGTRLAGLDDRVFAPLVVALVFGAVAALHIMGSPL
jgi:hypothetical protein